MPDFEGNLQQQKKQPCMISKFPKLDPEFEAVVKARQEKDAKNQFPNMPAQKGDWIVVTPLPTLQVIFHVDCPDDYLIGAVVGAMYGGHNDDSWNPLLPPHDEVIFTGRMSYSEEDPRHVTWFLDAMGVTSMEPTKEEMHVLDALKKVAVPNGTVLERLNSIVLVGTWNNRYNNNNRQDYSSAAMWTCQQEYRYGIMAGGKVFLSLGYEAMDDNNVETIPMVLDTVIRAKLHHHHSSSNKDDCNSQEQKTLFLRTPFGSHEPGRFEKFPKKRTPAEIFQYDLEHGERYTGIDQIMMFERTFPPKEELRRLSPHFRILDVEAINMILQYKFDCALATPLEEDVTLLLDELLMMFLHEEMVPGMSKMLQDTKCASIDDDDDDDDVDSTLKSLAECVFPNHNPRNPVILQCYQRLVLLSSSKSLVVESQREQQSDQKPSIASTGKRNSGLSDEKCITLKDRIGFFLTTHVASHSNDDEETEVVASLPILNDAGFLDRIYDVCEYLVLESLELANNYRRDLYLPSIVPRDIRHSISNDRELSKVLHVEETMEFFYPAHEKGGGSIAMV